MAVVSDWSKYPNFSKAEFTCKHTGRNEMQDTFMEKLQALRTAYGKPMTITSGFRDKSHPAERMKSRSGAHSTGRAADIAVAYSDAYKVLHLALAAGFTGIGIQQKGQGRFIHLDDLSIDDGFPRPTLWSY